MRAIYRKHGGTIRCLESRSSRPRCRKPTSPKSEGRGCRLDSQNPKYGIHESKKRQTPAVVSRLWRAIQLQARSGYRRRAEEQSHSMVNRDHQSASKLQHPNPRLCFRTFLGKTRISPRDGIAEKHAHNHHDGPIAPYRDVIRGEVQLAHRARNGPVFLRRRFEDYCIYK